jgi:hypothetical protein
MNPTTRPAGDGGGERPPAAPRAPEQAVRDVSRALPAEAAAARTPPDTEPPEARAPGGDGHGLLEWTKAIGMPLVTLVVTVLGGYYFTNLTKAREARESNERLYAQLLTQREQSDATIRKDMFSVVIGRFLGDAKKEDLGSRVLELELLATNFNQSLDLAPLFKNIARQLRRESTNAAQAMELRKRLNTTASNTISKQLNILARRGFVKDAELPLADWKKSPGSQFIDETIRTANLIRSTPDASIDPKEQIRFSVELVGVDLERRAVELRLQVDVSGGDSQDVDRHFWVDQYDFPMLDNTQVAHGLRTSIVMTEFFVPDVEGDREANSFVKLHLVVFPSSSASLKDRQDYDDVLMEMLRAQHPSPAGGQRP